MNNTTTSTKETTAAPADADRRHPLLDAWAILEVADGRRSLQRPIIAAEQPAEELAAEELAAEELAAEELAAEELAAEELAAEELAEAELAEGGAAIAGQAMPEATSPEGDYTPRQPDRRRFDAWDIFELSRVAHPWQAPAIAKPRVEAAADDAATSEVAVPKAG